jgi:hypothetical protein
VFIRYIFPRFGFGFGKSGNPEMDRSKSEKIDWLKAIKNVLLVVPNRGKSENFTTLVPVVAVAATVDCGRR